MGPIVTPVPFARPRSGREERTLRKRTEGTVDPANLDGDIVSSLKDGRRSSSPTTPTRAYEGTRV